jgi:CubicO group peptidase (beta-lactamase class C family)
MKSNPSASNDGFTANADDHRTLRSAVGAWLVCVLAVCTVGSVAAPQGTKNDPEYAVPVVKNITIDGALNDWEGQGFVIQAMTANKGGALTKMPAPPEVRIGWNTDGLLAALTVHDRQPFEYDFIRHLFKGDSVEFFVSRRKGSRDRYMVVVSPGLDSRYPEPRHCFFADPSEEAEKDLSEHKITVARKKTDDGYTMEVLLPWSNLPADPKVGLELALQVYIMDGEPTTPISVAMWHPGGDSHIDPRSTHRIRLADKPSSPLLLQATAQDDGENHMRRLRVVATEPFVDKPYHVTTGGGDSFFGTLQARNGQAFASLDLKLGESLTLLVDQRKLPVVVLPVMEKLKCRFSSAIFSGATFPTPYVEGVPEQWRVAKTTYYDANYNIVASAQRPGRYGAVIEIVNRNGITFRRFRTLFRVPDAIGTWRADRDKVADLPALVAKDPAVADSLRTIIGDLPNGLLRSPDAAASSETAALLSDVFEKQAGKQPEGPVSDYRAMDRQWWLGLKRNLYGWEKEFGGPLACPRPIQGQPAPVLRKGTLKEAGVSEAGVKELDRVLRDVLGPTSPPVGVCIARHGVIIIHEVYGQPGEKPFTLETPWDIMSATKPLGGTLMMMLVDQGKVRLDDSVDKFLPAFRGKKVRRPMVISDLYNHLNGLSGDWGDEIHDTEEIVAGYYTSVDVGNYSYNEVGYALGGKVIEAVTGEALPQYARRHLLDPLEMRHTRVTHSGGHNFTTSYDYAKLGQLLLNKGSYGNLRFFSPETFDKMVPEGARRGIGLARCPALGPNAFGHNSGNASMLAVDPDRDLVIVFAGGRGQKVATTTTTTIFKAALAALE